MMLGLKYSEFTSLVSSGAMEFKEISLDNKYILIGVDDVFQCQCEIYKSSDDANDYEANFQSLAVDKMSNVDPETGGIKHTNKFAPSGWLQRLHEVQFETATVDGNLHDKDYENNDTGWSSVRLYEGSHGSETEIIGANLTDQAYLDANCTRTDFLWMPNADYMILSGVLLQHETPLEDFFMWGLFLDTDPALHGMGILPIEVLGGGLNMMGVPPLTPVGLKGVSGSTVYYGGVMTPNGYVATGDGLGTNRIRYIMRHGTGKRHMFQSIFEIFRA